MQILILRGEISTAKTAAVKKHCGCFCEPRSLLGSLFSYPEIYFIFFIHFSTSLSEVR
jgi:hypothetical protein